MDQGYLEQGVVRFVAKVYASARGNEELSRDIGWYVCDREVVAYSRFVFQFCVSYTNKSSDKSL